jgi:hypothetical protein
MHFSRSLKHQRLSAWAEQPRWQPPAFFESHCTSMQIQLAASSSRSNAVSNSALRTGCTSLQEIWCAIHPAAAKAIVHPRPRVSLLASRRALAGGAFLQVARRLEIHGERRSQSNIASRTSISPAWQLGAVSVLRVSQRRGLTLRSTGQPTARRLGRAAAWFILPLHGPSALPLAAG